MFIEIVLAIIVAYLIISFWPIFFMIISAPFVIIFGLPIWIFSLISKAGEKFYDFIMCTNRGD